MIADVSECDAIPRKCAQMCREFKIGYLCYCKPGYRVHPTEPSLCLNVDECQESKPCSQVCHNTLGSYTCSCDRGYIAEDNGRICRANSCKLSAHN